MGHLSLEQLMEGLDHVRAAPPTHGELVAIVSRPAPGEREALTEATLDHVVGLVGDNWLARGSKDGPAVIDSQVTVMNVRAAELVADGTERLPLAGDQLYLDLDLSVDNLPAGSLIRVGHAVLEVSDRPHLGCAKFLERFGEEAMRLVNSRVGRELRLRGANTRVVVPGVIRVGDIVTREAPPQVL